MSLVLLEPSTLILPVCHTTSHCILLRIEVLPLPLSPSNKYCWLLTHSRYSWSFEIYIACSSSYSRRAYVKGLMFLTIHISLTVYGLCVNRLSSPHIVPLFQ